MGALPVEHVIAVLLEQFAEAYEGPTQEYTWFIDNNPGGGLFHACECRRARGAAFAKLGGKLGSPHR